jgi:sensor histidine kinase YesM
MNGACSNANICGDANHAATFDCLTQCIFPSIVNAAFIFIGSVVVILIILSGYKFIMSRGDSKQLEGARKTLTYAIIGLLVVLFSVFLINIIGKATGVNCITKGFGFLVCQ